MRFSFGAWAIPATYDVGGLLFSLIDIEHCVLRNAMSVPQAYWTTLSTSRFGATVRERGRLHSSRGGGLDAPLPAGLTV